MSPSQCPLPNFQYLHISESKAFTLQHCISANRKIHSIRLHGIGVGNWQGPRATNTRVGFRYNTEIFYQEIRLNVTTF